MNNKLVVDLIKQLVKMPSKATLNVSTNSNRGIFATAFIKKNELIMSRISPLAIARTSTNDIGSIPAATYDVPDIIELYNKIREYENNLTEYKHEQQLQQQQQHSTYEQLITKLAIRIIWEGTKGYNSSEILSKLLSCPDMSTFLQIDGVNDHFKQLEAKVMKALTALNYGKEGRTLLMNASGDGSCQWLLHTWGALSLNCIRTPAGTAIYALPSFLNHSCKPNVGFMYDSSNISGLMSMVATDDIEEGSQLTINYIESLQSNDNSSNESGTPKKQLSFEQLNNHLLHNYGFHCNQSTCLCGRII